MRRPPLSATRRLAAAIAAFGATVLTAAPANAQEADPFALPREVTIADAAQASGPGLSLISVDGREAPRMVRLAWVEGDLAIEAEAAVASGLPVEPGAKGFIRLKSLHLADWSFNRLTQHLDVTLYRHGDGPNDVDLARQDRRPGQYTPFPALLMDYDLSATANRDGIQAAGLAVPRFVYGNFQLSGSFQFVSEPTPGTPRIRRLDSFLQLATPEKGLVVTAGDFIGTGAQSQRPLRLGGLQIASDFALRPDLVTAPLPEFASNVAVPTGLDLIVNDQRFTGQEIQAGDFQIRNIPVNPGRGQVSVIVHDALGREIVQSAQIYMSREMLAPGLWQYGANIGWVRRRYGQVSNDYRDLASSFFLRRGVSRRLSLGMSGEAGLGVRNFGAQFEATLGSIAMLFGEMRVSDSPEGAGRMLRGGIESYGNGFSTRLEAVFPSSGYRDLAAMAGDPRIPRQINAIVDFDLRDTLKLQLTASHQSRPFDSRYPLQERKVDLAHAIFRKQVNQRIDLHADLAWRNGEKRSVSAMIGVSIQLGGKHGAQASATRSSHRTRTQASFYRPDILPGDIGYMVEASNAETRRIAGNLAWRNRYNRIEAQTEYNAGRIAGRANARGTLLFAGNRLYARNQTGGSYALVSTGKVGGITVTRENRPAGKTDSRGRLLVEDLTPLVPLQFDIDPDKLPADAIARSTYQRVVFARNAVGRVKLDIAAFRSLPVRLLDAQGHPLPVGTYLKARPSGDRYMVGYDGLIDYNALSGDTALAMEGQGDDTCPFTLPAGIENEAADTLQLRKSCAALLFASRSGP